MKKWIAPVAITSLVAGLAAGALTSGASANPSNVNKVRVWEYGHNAVGTDTSANRNQEFVRLRNVSGEEIDVTGWILHDTYQNSEGDWGNKYVFKTTDLPAGSPFLKDGRFVMPPGSDVYIYNGSGTDPTPTNTTAAIYRNYKHHWNNAGDTIYLRDADGTVVHRVDYTSYRELIR